MYRALGPALLVGLIEHVYCCVGWFSIMGIDLPDRNNIYNRPI